MFELVSAYFAERFWNPAVLPRFIISPVFFYLTSTFNEWSDLDFLKDIIFRNTSMLTATCYDYIKTYSTHYNWIEDNSEFIFAARSRSLHKSVKKEYIRGGEHPFLSGIWTLTKNWLFQMTKYSHGIWKWVLSLRGSCPLAVSLCQFCLIVIKWS